MNSLEEVKNIPVGRSQNGQIDLRNVADVTTGTVLGEYDRYNMQRMLVLGANIGAEHLGEVAGRVSQAIDKMGRPPQGVNVNVRGQVVPMEEMFSGLQLGLFVAIIVIFLLLAANFQSFRLSFAVVLTIPAVISGVVLALWITGTTLNIQSLMGAIMAIGVAVANAILLVTFAERYRMEGEDAASAADWWRSNPVAAHPHDQLRDDRRHVADGNRTWRRGRSKRPARTSGDRRPERRDHRDTDHPAGNIRDPAKPANAGERIASPCRPRSIWQKRCGRARTGSTLDSERVTA